MRAFNKLLDSQGGLGVATVPKEDICSHSVLQARISSRRGTAILFAEQTAVKRIGSTPFSANPGRTIGRAIVDQNPLHFAVALPFEETKRGG